MKIRWERVVRERGRIPRQWSSQNNSEPHLCYTCVNVSIYIRYLTIHGTRSALCHFLFSNACVRLLLWIAPPTIYIYMYMHIHDEMEQNETSRNKKAQSAPRKRKQQRQRQRRNKGGDWGKNLTETSLSIIYHIHFYFIICRSNRFQTFLNRFFALHAWISIIKITIINK